VFGAEPNLMDVCTIIARNYLAAARVLAESLREHHPDSRCHVLVIDEVEGYFDPAAEPFEVLRPEALELPDFERMAGIYQVLELATAVKPWLLRTLLREVEDGIVYLDPDIRLYAPITDVFEAVHEHGLVLNPHNTEPMPRDTFKPSEQDILLAGTYNLGFIGLGRSEFSDAFLDWWSERLKSHCIVDPARGFFVDQRWVDLVPGLAPDFHLIRDPGFNVAYWNLATRELARRNGRYLINDKPLRLFHFSGFKPTRPHLLSQYQDRVRLGDDPVLTHLCRDYADALLAAGHSEASAWPYGYSSSYSGIWLEPSLRAAYRRAISEDDVSGSLFTAEGEREFVSWANLPSARGGTHGVTRFLDTVYERRPDLQTAYPDLEDPAIAAGYLGWARVNGSTEVPIHETFLPAAKHAEPPSEASQAPRERPLALNVAGYLNAELGVGEVARQLIAALDAHRVPLLPVGLLAPNSRQGHEFAAPAGIEAPFDITLLCVNADGLPVFAEQAGEQFFEERYSIGVWWWELSEFPASQVGAFEWVDEVWVGSRFVANALQRVAPVPVMYLPLPVQISAGVQSARYALDLPPKEFIFLFSFDYNSVFKRKNPLQLVEAFTRAFAPDEGVRLVVKSINSDRDPDNHDRLRIATESHPHVQLIDRYLPAQDNQRLLASCDAYVSLHRSEGFGIGMAEALLYGKPLVATAYGGNTDYLTEATGYPISYALVPVGDGAWPYEPTAQWAQPDLDDAVRQLRAVVEGPSEAAVRVRRAQQLLSTDHSPSAAGERMLRRLESIHARPRPKGSRPGKDSDLPLLDDLRRRTERGPVPAESSTFRPARGMARRALLRVMRPYTAHADAVAQDLIDAVQQAADRSAETAEERAFDGSMATAAALADARRLRTRVEELDQVAGSAGRDAAKRAVEEALQSERSSDVRTHAVGLAARESSALALTDYPDAPEGEPWDHAYVEDHRGFINRALDDGRLINAFRGGQRLPARYGTGFDERVVEFPWIASRRLAGRVLDAGSSLNHAHVLVRLRPRMDDLHIVTLSPEEESFPELGVSYVFADLRDLPFRDSTYDHIVSISTLDHVGMDNARFGADAPSAEDPQEQSIRAVGELRRVLRPGGDLYLTLPVGQGERFAWVRSFTGEELDQLVEAFEPADVTMAFFRHEASTGWRRAERDEVASARYRDHFSSGPVGPDRVAAAEAVACVHLVRPG
jgi:glycosyltransferase involved in cell wall biosynthesis/SAM-dependent methyltransferase